MDLEAIICSFVAGHIYHYLTLQHTPSLCVYIIFFRNNAFYVALDRYDCRLALIHRDRRCYTQEEGSCL